LQYNLVKLERDDRKEEIGQAILNSVEAGSDIKKRCNDVVHGLEESDPNINHVVEILLRKNPFIQNAQNALNDWSDYSNKIFQISKSATDNGDFIHKLWCSSDDIKLLVRRLLLRVGTDESINYIQDLDIEGITEHNLYKGSHTGHTLSKIVDYITSSNPDYSIVDFRSALTSKKAMATLKSSVWFEARNGTDLKPSFDYIELVLKKKGFVIRSASSLTVKPIGFHAELTESVANVRPYTNLKVILDANGKLLAYLKGKYFGPPEFPRRCKEEAYVALTLKYKLVDSSFRKRIDVPIIMFIDMPQDYTPPEYALERLMQFGWSVAFNAEQVVELFDEKC